MSSKQILQRLKLRDLARFRSNYCQTHYKDCYGPRVVAQYIQSKQITSWFKQPSKEPKSNIIIEDPEPSRNELDFFDLFMMQLRSSIRTDYSKTEKVEYEELSKKLQEALSLGDAFKPQYLSTFNALYLKIITKEKDLLSVMPIAKWEKLFSSSVACIDESAEFPYLQDLFHSFLKLNYYEAIVPMLEYTIITQQPQLFQDILIKYLKQENDSDSTIGVCLSLMDIFQKRDLAETEVFLKIMELYSENDAVMNKQFTETYEKICDEKINKDTFNIYDVEKSTNRLVEYVLKNNSKIIDVKIHLLYLCAKYGCETSERSLINNIDLYQKDFFEYVEDKEDIVFSLLMSSIKANKFQLAQTLKGIIERKNFSQSQELLIIWDVFTNHNDDLSKVFLSLDKLHEQMKDSEEFTQILNHCIEVALHANKSETFKKELQTYIQVNFDLELSTKFFSLAIEKEISNHDVEAAKQAFQRSISNGVDWGSKESLPYIHTINNLMVFLAENCDNDKPSLNIMKKHYSKFREQIGQLNFKAVGAVVKKMADNNYGGDAVYLLKEAYPDIARESADKLPLSECSTILKSLLEFIHRYTDDLDHGWFVLIEVHRIFFPPYETYLPLIKFYCRHNKLNYALTVFKKLIVLNQLHGHPGPNYDIYCYLMRQFGKQGYKYGLVDVHSFLKMDLVVDQDINLMNSILYGYAAVREQHRVQEIFATIETIPKERGINEETACIMLQHFSDRLNKAQNFWLKLSEYDILPTEDMFRQYLIAYCWADQAGEACKITEQMKDYNLKVSPKILTALYNYSHPDRGEREVVEKWAVENYPEEWQKASESGQLMTDNEIFISLYGDVLEGNERVNIAAPDTKKLLI